MADPLTVIAKLVARDDQAEALGAALRGLIAPSRTEAGCLSYQLHRSDTDRRVWFLYETWRSRADLDAHFARPYTAEVLQRLPDLLDGGMELNTCGMVEP